MDAFQGCYHHKPSERRYFAAFYLLVRIIHSIAFLCIKSVLFVAVTCFFLVVLVITLIIFQPYKSKNQNAKDEILILIFVIANFMGIFFENTEVPFMYTVNIFKLLMLSAVGFLLCMHFIMLVKL